MANLLLVERYHLLPNTMSDRLSGLVANEHGVGMDVGDQHHSSLLDHCRPARAGLLGPEDLALAREAAWIRVES